ncbi:MAG: hypothetical protein J6X92_07700, partial [Bacteroidales bacterium]|nr:hypothetical protein [Bacteroidales bacterium]
VGILQIVFGSLIIVAAIVLFILLTLFNSQVENVVIYNIFKCVCSGLLLFFGVIKLIGGIGVLKYRQWGRYMVIAISALDCLNVPFGTLFGVYSMWVLLQEQTLQLYPPKAEKE